MNKIGTLTFSGIRPVLSPRLLQDNEAQIADNCDLTSGDIRQVQRPLTVYSTSVNGVDAFMLYDLADAQAWLTWSDDGTKVVPGHIHDDEHGRCYMTDADGAKMFTVEDVSGTFAPRTLGIPAPTATPSATSNGAGSGDIFTTAYIFTLVSIYGEEGAPSPASNLIDRKDGDTVSLTGLNTPTVTGYNEIAYKRIYRLMTGESGGTEFQFVADIDVDDTTYSDTVDNADLGEVCPSQEWLTPPEGLQGMISKGGLYAGFVGRDLWYSEPLYPHAWPLKYNQSLEADVVGHCFVGDYQVILTEGKVYVADCSDITYSFPRGLQGQAPCKSAKGIVSTPFGALFPGQDGLYLVEPSATYAVNVSKGVFGEDDWAYMRPETMVAAWHLNRYYCWYTDKAGVKRGFILDFSAEGVTLARGMGFSPVATYVEPDGNILYLATESAGRTDISAWGGSIVAYRAEWRSKVFTLPTEVNMAAAQIEADFRDGLSQEDFQAMMEEIILANQAFLDAGDFYGELGAAGPGEYVFGGDALDGIFVTYTEVPQIVFQVYGDGVLRFTKEVNVKGPFTLPAGYTAKEWVLAISADIPVKSVFIAPSMTELLA